MAFFVLAAGFLLGASAIALPYLVESSAVRESLVRNMASWTGGEVRINGRIRMASFIALTIEARDVTFSGTKRLDPVARIEARSLKGIASLTSLLRGKIEFRKVIISFPKIVLRGNLERQAEAAGTGLKVLGTPIALAAASPFADLIVKDSTAIVTDDKGHPQQTFAIPWIELTKTETQSTKSALFSSEGQALPNTQTSYVAMSVRLDGAQASFRGEIDSASQVANGTLNVSVGSTQPVAQTINRAVFPWEEICDVSLSARLSWSPDRIALDKARFRFADRKANGSLALALAGGRLTIEATLAYDTIDASRLVSAIADHAPTATDEALAAIFPRDGTLPAPDLDLRLSADQVKLPKISGGPLAIAVTSQRGRLSADLAELDLFGGSLRGRLDYDPTEAQGAILKATGEHINAQALSAAFALPGLVNGNANFALSLSIPQTSKPGAGLWGTGTKGRFAISLPAGGTLEASLSRQLSQSVRDLTSGRGWISDDDNGLSLSELTVEGKLEREAIAATARGEMEKGQLSASLKINLPGGALNGTLALSAPGSTANSNSDAATGIEPAQPAQLATLSIGGTASLPEFSAAARHFSN